MDTREFIKISIIIGVVATTVMTVVMLSASRITNRRLNVIRILGTMLTGSALADGGYAKSRWSIFVGSAVHYGVGLFFTTAYILLWSRGIWPLSIFYTLILGFITGLLGVAVWRAYFFVHRHPPKVPLRLYLIYILFAHIVFALSAQLCYIIVY